MLKSLARRAADLYFLPLRKSNRLRAYVNGVFFVDPEQHLSATTRFIKKHVTPAPNDIIVDVGGAGGGTSVFFSDAFPGLKVFCVEPNPRMLTSLRQVESAHQNIIVTPLALGRSSGEATLHVTANDLSSSLNEIDLAELQQTPADFQGRLHEDQQVRVRTSTLDEEFKEHRRILRALVVRDNALLASRARVV